MNIGIDIDDTIVNTYEPMKKYADMFDINVLGNTGANTEELGMIDHGHYLEVIYNWDRKIKFDYFDTYYKNVLEECTMLPNAKEIIQKLYNEGNNIFFVTARVSKVKNCNTEELTKKTLKNNDIPYNKLIIDADDKAKYCKENGIDVFIDDSYATCKSIKENGVKVYLMTTKVNCNLDTEDIERVKDWKEIYEKIHNMKQ